MDMLLVQSDVIVIQGLNNLEISYRLAIIVYTMVQYL
jgi:hypothetical protein